MLYNQYAKFYVNNIILFEYYSLIVSFRFFFPERERVGPTVPPPPQNFICDSSSSSILAQIKVAFQFDDTTIFNGSDVRLFVVVFFRSLSLSPSFSRRNPSRELTHHVLLPLKHICQSPFQTQIRVLRAALLRFHLPPPKNTKTRAKKDAKRRRCTSKRETERYDDDDDDDVYFSRKGKGEFYFLKFQETLGAHFLSFFRFFLRGDIRCSYYSLFLSLSLLSLSPFSCCARACFLSVLTPRLAVFRSVPSFKNNRIALAAWVEKARRGLNCGWELPPPLPWEEHFDASESDEEGPSSYTPPSSPPWSHVATSHDAEVFESGEEGGRRGRNIDDGNSRRDRRRNLRASRQF